MRTDKEDDKDKHEDTDKERQYLLMCLLVSRSPTLLLQSNAAAKRARHRQ